MQTLPLISFSLLLAVSTANAQTGSQIFSAVTPNTVILLQWTEAGGQLKGSAQVVNVTPNVSGIQLVVANSGLSGTRSGNDYSLIFDKSILGTGVSSAPAQLNKDRLSISIPSDIGGLTEIVLQRASLAKFNAAVIKLKADAAIEVIAIQSNVVTFQTAAQLDDILHQLRLSLSTLEADALPDPKALSILVNQIDMQVAKIAALGRGGKCSEVETASDAIVIQFPAFDTTVSKLSEAVGQFGSAYDTASGAIPTYQAALNTLNGLSPNMAKKYASDNAGLLKRVAAALARTKQPIQKARQTLDLSAARLQNFNDTLAAINCPRG